MGRGPWWAQPPRGAAWWRCRWNGPNCPQPPEPWLSVASLILVPSGGSDVVRACVRAGDTRPAGNTDLCTCPSPSQAPPSSGPAPPQTPPLRRPRLPCLQLVILPLGCDSDPLPVAAGPGRALKGIAVTWVEVRPTCAGGWGRGDVGVTGWEAGGSEKSPGSLLRAQEHGREAVPRTGLLLGGPVMLLDQRHSQPDTEQAARFPRGPCPSASRARPTLRLGWERCPSQFPIAPSTAPAQGLTLRGGGHSSGKAPHCT